MLLEAKPEVVSFHFGLPDPDIVQAIKSAGIFVVSSATTVAEARMLERAGMDAVIAQGTEAGGHRATFSGVDVAMQPGLFALLPQVVDAVGIPVIAAGGVADSRTVAAAFMLGASAVQLGTAFMRCEEANLRDAQRTALADADDACTVVDRKSTQEPAGRRPPAVRAAAAAGAGPAQPDLAARRLGRPGVDGAVLRPIRRAGQGHQRRRTGPTARRRNHPPPARLFVEDDRDAPLLWMRFSFT